MFKFLHLYMLRFKVFSVVLHVAGWLLFMIFPLLFINAGQDESIFSVLKTAPYIEFCLCYIVLFYVHTDFLVPRFFLQKRYLIYMISVLLLLAAVNTIRPFDKLVAQNRGNNGRSILNPTRPPGADGQNHRPPGAPPNYGENPPPPPNDFDGVPQKGPQAGTNHIDITSIFIFIIVLAFSMAIRLVKQWQQTEQRALRAEADKANAELSFLKAQINPHFLYNTLNNIYTLSLMQSEDTSDSIMKLSSIMRFVIDDATKEFVSLKSEIECINNYVDLQKLRIGEKVKLDFKVVGKLEKLQIAPMILMTFVENLFKYGISKHTDTALKIHVTVNENELIFVSENPVFDRNKPLHGSGIGIKNTTQRLDFLYLDKYKLHIVEEENLFKVELKLQL